MEHVEGQPRLNIDVSTSGTVGTTRDRIKSLITRVERLESEKADLSKDIGEILKNAKNDGFDIKALRLVIKLRKMASDERAQLEELVTLYMDAVGEPKQGILPV